MQDHCIGGGYVCSRFANNKQKTMEDLSYRFNELSEEVRVENLLKVLRVMVMYGHDSGWMRWDGKSLNFYVGQVEFGAYVEKKWLNELKKTPK